MKMVQLVFLLFYLAVNDLIKDNCGLICIARLLMYLCQEYKLKDHSSIFSWKLGYSIFPLTCFKKKFNHQFLWRQNVLPFDECLASFLLLVYLPLKNVIQKFFSSSSMRSTTLFLLSGINDIVSIAVCSIPYCFYCSMQFIILFLLSYEF